MMDLLNYTEDLMNQFNKASYDDKWWIPFPMGVFGTLRKGCGNSYLMGGEGGRKSYKYNKWGRAFLPHYVAEGLTIYHSQGSSAVFEFYNYDADNWKKMIPGVDQLEGFFPSKEPERRAWGYHRTLVMLRLLPDEYKHEHYDRINLGYSRSLFIPEDQWEQYPSFPAWVYSNGRANTSSIAAGNTPIVWQGLAEDVIPV